MADEQDDNEQDDNEQGNVGQNRHAEGWFTDPFGRHEARWMSDGTPTKLVRDEETETDDDPPDEAWSPPLRPIEMTQAADGRDLLRARDAGGGETLSERMSEAAEFGSTWGSHIALRNLHDDR